MICLAIIHSPKHHHTLEGLLSIPHLCQAHLRSSHCSSCCECPTLPQGLIFFSFSFVQWMISYSSPPGSKNVIISTPPGHTIHFIYYFISHFYNSSWHLISTNTYNMQEKMKYHQWGDNINFNWDD